MVDVSLVWCSVPTSTVAVSRADVMALACDLGLIGPKVKRPHVGPRFRQACQETATSFEENGVRYTLKARESVGQPEVVVMSVVMFRDDDPADPGQKVAEARCYLPRRTSRGLVPLSQRIRTTARKELTPAQEAAVDAWLARMRRSYDGHDARTAMFGVRQVVRQVLDDARAIGIPRHKGGMYFVYGDRTDRLPALRQFLEEIGADVEMAQFPLIVGREQKAYIVECADATVTRRGMEILESINRLQPDITSAHAIRWRYVKTVQDYQAEVAFHEDRLECRLDHSREALQLCQGAMDARWGASNLLSVIGG